jgi:anti-sigma B factor antagonist
MSESSVICRDGCLRVEGDMTIYAAAGIKDQLFALAPDCGADIELDLSAVSALDTAGLQIMLMLRRLAHSKGAAFRLLRPSHAAIEVLELCGMQKLISDNSAESVKAP